MKKINIYNITEEEIKLIREAKDLSIRDVSMIYNISQYHARRIKDGIMTQAKLKVEKEPFVYYDKRRIQQQKTTLANG